MSDIFTMKQSEATAAYRRVYFHAVDATDGITAETGLTGTAFISKNGAAPAATTNSLVEISAGNMPGRYYVELTAAELSDLGNIAFRYKAAACAEVTKTVVVVGFDPIAAPADPINANVTQVSGDSVAADNAEAFFDGSGYAGTGNVIPTVTTLTNKTGFELSGAGVTAVAAGIWNAAVTSYQVQGSFGQVLQPAHSGTAQAGAALSITLAAGASATNDYYNGGIVVITSGTGAGQGRLIEDAAGGYVGATKVATVTTAWTTNPDATSVYMIFPVIRAA